MRHHDASFARSRLALFRYGGRCQVRLDPPQPCGSPRGDAPQPVRTNRLSRSGCTTARVIDQACPAVACGGGGAPQPVVRELVDALENGVMTTSCVCAFAASLNWVSLRTRLGPIWASATGATETFSSSDLRSTASGALEKRWRLCSSRKTTSKDVRCTPTRCAAAFFSLAACPDLLLRRRTHWGSEIGPCFRKLRGTTDTELVLHVATLVLPVRLRGRPLRPANRLR